MANSKNQIVPLPLPLNVPKVAKVVRYWSYREWWDLSKRPSGKITWMYHKEFTCDGVDDITTLREALAQITGQVENHSGWEVELLNGRRAMFFFSDCCFYIYGFPMADIQKL
jgi:hypothetical protein